MLLPHGLLPLTLSSLSVHGTYLPPLAYTPTSEEVRAAEALGQGLHAAQAQMGQGSMGDGACVVH